MASSIASLLVSVPYLCYVMPLIYVHVNKSDAQSDGIMCVSSDVKNEWCISYLHEGTVVNCKQ